MTADKRFEAHWNSWVEQTSASSWEIFIEIDCKAKVNRKHRSAAIEIVFRVNWFVDFVNWTNDEDCNLILFDIVIWRFWVKEIKYSLVKDWEFNSFSNWTRVDWLNELFVGWFRVVKDEIEIVERGIPLETALSNWK